MVIGTYEKCVKKNFVTRMITTICGTVDYHSHIRLKPLIKYAKRKGIYGNFLEIGCGSGLVAFELNRRGHVNSYTGIDMNECTIGEAERIRKSLDMDNLTFILDDAFHYLDYMTSVAEYDYVVLYDFIEHIPNPEIFLAELLKYIRGGGFYCLRAYP